MKILKNKKAQTQSESGVLGSIVENIPWIIILVAALAAIYLLFKHFKII